MTKYLLYFFLLLGITKHSYAQYIYGYFPNGSTYTLGCNGGSFKIKYSSGSTFTSGNTFTVQLSNSSGSFASPTVVGTYTSTNATDSIAVTLPSNLSSGSTYYLRVVSSSPIVTGSGISLTIGTPSALGTVSANTPLCTGNTLRLASLYQPTNGGTYLWSGPQGFSSTDKNPFISNVNSSMSGTYSVRQRWLGGCTSTASSLNVTISATVAPLPTTASGNTTLCRNDTLRLTATTVAGAGYLWYEINMNTISTVQNPVINPAPYASGLFTVRTVVGSFSGGTCYSDTTRFLVTIKDVPTVDNLTVNNQVDLVCSGSNVVLSVDPNSYTSTYQWTGPGGFSATGYNVTHSNVTVPGTYTMKESTSMGCSASATSNYLGIEQSVSVSPDQEKWIWANSLNSSNSSGLSAVNDLSKDKLGNVYLAMDANYTAARPLKFTPTDSIAPYGNYDGIIAKYSSDGKFKWAQRMGGTGSDHIVSIAVDSIGNSYVLGYFPLGATAAFGPYTLNSVSNNGSNFFIAKLDSAGNFLWVKQGADTTVSGYASAIVRLGIDKKGNCYFAGTSKGRFSIGGMSIQTQNYIGKLSSQGQMKWLKPLRIAPNDYPVYEMAIDSIGNSYLIGIVGFNPFFMKVDSMGNIVATKVYNQLRPGGNLNKNFILWGPDVKLGTDGLVNMAFPIFSSYKSSADTDGVGPYYIVLLKTDQQGNEIYRRYINQSTSRVKLELDNQNNIYLAGVLKATYACSNVSLTPAYSVNSSFLSKYNSSGTLQWVKPIRAQRAVHVLDSNGDIYFAGNNSYTQAFGSVTLKGEDFSGIGMIGKLGTLDSIPKTSFTSAKYCLPDSVVFTNTTELNTGTIQSTVWDFGDPASGVKNSATSFHAKHLYATSGTYTVTLTVTTSFNKVKSFQKTVQVYLKPDIHATHSAYLCANAPVTWSAACSNLIATDLTWTWNFGDPASGSVNASSLLSPTHLYNSTGTYSVSVIGQKNGCSDTSVAVITISPKPTATVVTDLACSNAPTKFTASTTQNITSWNWNFGDAASSSNTAAIQNPTHQFSALSTFQVKLALENDLACKDTLTKSVQITQSPQVQFYPTTYCRPNSATYSDWSVVPNGVASTQWTNYDDNGFFFQTNTGYCNFPAAGVYHVKLKITDTKGCIDSLIKPVNIYDAKTPEIVYVNDSLKVYMSGSFVWFKDNVELSGLVTNKILPPGDGTYYVTVVDSNGCYTGSDAYQLIVTGLDQAGTTQHVVYPNPSTGTSYLSVSSASSGPSQVVISNILGETLWMEEKTVQNGDNLLLLDLNTLAPGVYTLLWTAPDGAQKRINLIRK